MRFDSSKEQQLQYQQVGSLIMRSMVGVVLCLATAGCGEGRPERILVSGKVLLDGKELPDCSLQFASPNGRSSYGLTDENGEFTLGCYEEADGILPGTHQVVAVAKKDIDASTMQWLAPKKYIDFKTSGLEYTIEEPRDDLVIELTWDGDKPFMEREGKRVRR